MDLSYFSSLIGCATITYISFKCLCSLWSMFRSYGLTSIGFVKDLSKYGEWVIVTGATDGIGKEYAKQFAQRGFKIVLISRTAEKLQQLSKEIEDEFDVETKFICFDFTRTIGYDEIEDVVKQLDVGILVNNVGMSTGPGRSFFDEDIDAVDNVLHCNMFSDVHMTHIILKGMVERQRGFILHVSSIAIYTELPIPIYSSTKVFMQKFYKSLQLEESGIDHQLVTPGFVATKLSKKKAGFTIPTAEDYVKSAIRTIGIADMTCGYLSHELIRVVVLALPKCVWTIIAKLIARRRLKTK